MSSTASPVSSGNQPNRDAGTPAGRSSTLTVSPVPGGETQLRVIRPRPASWYSATSTVRSGAPAVAAASRSAFVEPVRSTTSSCAHGPTRAARSAPASSGWVVTFMLVDATSATAATPTAEAATATGGRAAAPGVQAGRTNVLTGRPDRPRAGRDVALATPEDPASLDTLPG